MTELQEVAYQCINDPELFNATNWPYMNSVEDLYDQLTGYKDNKSLLSDNLRKSIANEIADIMFIEEKK